MEPTALGTFLKLFGGKFFSFLFPKIKNSKFYRDVQDKWVKDNYAQKTTFMFKAAIEDAKVSLDLPEDFVIKILQDSINRDEVFHWVLEGTPEKIDENRLNLEPYIESFPQYQDLIRPFFELITLNLNAYKIKYWEPEFLVLLSKLDNLEKITEAGFNKLLEKQTSVIQLAEENNRFLREVIAPTEFKDLNELINVRKLITAREKANERLRKPNLKRNEILELNAIIAKTYIESKEYDESIRYLYTAITNCDDEPRKYRLESLINIFQSNFEKAHEIIKKAIEIEGETIPNIEILINILIEQKMFDEALKIIEGQTVGGHEILKANILLSLNEFEKVNHIANGKLEIDSSDIDWLMLKAESCILKIENDINNNKIVYPEQALHNVIPLLEQVEKSAGENREILKRVKELKAALYFRNNKFSEAKLLYEELFLENKDFSGLFFKNLLLNCLCSKDWGKSISLLEDKGSEQQLSNEEIVTLADVYIKTGKTDEAISLLKGNEAYFRTSTKFPYRFYFSYIDVLFSVFKYKEIDNLINSIEKEGNNPHPVIILKGYYSYKNQDWENVINYLEPNIDQLDEVDLIETKSFLSAGYLNRGTKEDYIKLKTIIVSMPHWIQHEFLVNRYVQALFHLGEYQNIINLYEEIPHKSKFLFDIITTIYFNLGWYDIAMENYLTLYQQSGNLEYQLRYANCLYRSGKIKDCLEILSTAEKRVEKSGKTGDFQLLSLSFMDAREYRKAMEYSFKTYKSGKDNHHAWGFFIIQMSQLGQFVDNPDEEWIKEYQKMFTEFEKVFPDERPPFKMVPTLEDGKISNELIEELKHSKDVTSLIKTLLDDNKFPISFLVSVMNKGPFETWAHIANTKDNYLWTLNGSIEEIFNGAFISGLSSNILCDFTTLLTIQYLDLLDLLKYKFKLYIHQEQFDAALQEFTRNKLINEKGLKLLSYQDGNVRMIEYTSEQVKETLRKQENLIKWVEENCIKLGNVIKNNHTEENEDNTINFLNNPLELCKDKSLTMLVDSVSVRDYAKEYYEVNCFSTIDLITLFLAQNKIDKEKHHQLIGKLLMLGYVLIPIHSDLFIYYLKNNNYKITYEISLLFDYLKLKSFNEDFLINFIAEIFHWIWIENIPINDRRLLTDELCSVISINKNKSVVTKKIIDHSKTIFSFLVEHQWEKMKECIEEWIEAQSII
ncbi:hypothetical protein KW850_31390 [Bacillus sp. sid0103]|uniref:tetratricopeptide repeat protein n=1 Tax=Bacillus sp. sid0103 TaxID=2856337 RepID=UPI001C4557DE|nr:hypothetical protein [Bacillus sp. sid0103]MBV7509627.1 hypothetical protein [Bacillus sp. sid0103]